MPRSLLRPATPVRPTDQRSRMIAEAGTNPRPGAGKHRTSLLERLHAVDPGLARVRSAAQSLLSLIVGGGLGAGLMYVAGQPIQTGVLGGMVALMGTMLVQGPTPRAKLIRIGHLALTAILSGVVAAALSAWPFLSYTGFLGVMAGAAWVQRWGPAGIGIGMIAFMAHFNTLFLRVGPAQIPWLVPALALGFVGLALSTLVLVPDRTRTRVRRIVPGFRARILRLVEIVREETERGALDRAGQSFVDAISNVQETALLIDTTLEGPAARAGVADPLRLRDHAFAAEILADHLVATAMTALRRNDVNAREAIIRQIDAMPLHSQRPVQPPPTIADLLPPHPALSADRVPDLLRRLVLALQSVEAAALPPEESPPGTVQPWPVSVEADEKPGPGEKKEAGDRSPVMRKTVQVTLAGALSIVAGMWLSEAYWYFAVMGAFFTLVTTPTRGASVRRAVDRILGTAVGVAGGVGLAFLLADSTGAELVVIFAMAFIAFWSFKSSYMVVIFLFTAMVALVYEMMGIYSIQLLLVRLWETLIGAGFGALAAFLVLPVSTRSSLNEHLVKSLGALDDLLGTLDPRNPDPITYEAVYDDIRDLDRAVSAFREAGKPLESGLPLRSARETRRDVLLMSSLRFRTRDLVTATTGPDGRIRPVEPEAVPTLDAVRRRVAWIRRQIEHPGAPTDLVPATLADEQALAAAPGRTGSALRAIYERLESFAESRALASEATPEPADA